MKVFLDSVIEPTVKGFTVVRSYEEFKSLLEDTQQCPDFISFGHDLESEKTGYHCALLLVEMHMSEKLIIPEWFTFCVHSYDVSEKENITWILNHILKSFYHKRHTEMNVKLLPCPACGHEATVKVSNKNKHHFYVVCSYCEHVKTKEMSMLEAVAAWNSIPRNDGSECIKSVEYFDSLKGTVLATTEKNMQNRAFHTSRLFGDIYTLIGVPLIDVKKVVCVYKEGSSSVSYIFRTDNGIVGSFFDLEDGFDITELEFYDYKKGTKQCVK